MHGVLLNALQQERRNVLRRFVRRDVKLRIPFIYLPDYILRIPIGTVRPIEKHNPRSCSISVIGNAGGSLSELYCRL